VLLFSKYITLGDLQIALQNLSTELRCCRWCNFQSGGYGVAALWRILGKLYQQITQLYPFTKHSAEFANCAD